MNRTTDAESGNEEEPDPTEAVEQAARQTAMGDAVEIIEMEWSSALALQLMKKAAKKPTKKGAK
jgi:hypothetical protein